MKLDITPADLLEFFVWYKKEVGRMPYPSQVAANWHLFRPSTVNLTPVKLTPADVLAALAPLRGLQNGALREAINQLPPHIKGTAGKAVKNYRDATGVHYELQNLTLEILEKGMEA
jgi:hypothetical protein